MASQVWYDSGNFYAWIGGILTPISVGSGSNPSSQGLNSPLALDGLDGEDFFIPGLNQPSLDDVAYKNRTNAFTQQNSFAGFPLDLLSGQIKFPASQNASSDANTLDDYERGDWTPLIGGSVSESGQSYNIQVGKYIKIGRSVLFKFAVRLTNKGTITGGSVHIKGLPFTHDSSSLAYSAPGAIYFEDMATTWTSISGFMSPGNLSIGLTGMKVAAITHLAVVAADIANNTFIIGAGVYPSTS